MANPKEKTPMCLVNELARFNKIQPEYKLLSEQGPAHSKVPIHISFLFLFFMLLYFVSGKVKYMPLVVNQENLSVLIIRYLENKDFSIYFLMPEVQYS